MRKIPMIFDIENNCLWNLNFGPQNSMISFGYVNFLTKIFIILYPRTWNSITCIAIDIHIEKNDQFTLCFFQHFCLTLMISHYSAIQFWLLGLLNMNRICLRSDAYVLLTLDKYRISSYSFHPWIVSAAKILFIR